MRSLDFDQMLAQTTATVSRLTANPDFDLIIVGSSLAMVVVLSLLTIWRGRAKRTAAPTDAPSSVSGFRRWLTPMGMQSIPAEQAVVSRPRRRSGSNKTIRVSTPVSKVAARALKASGADALDIARRTGLARDAVVMMMANADPKAHAAKTSAAKSTGNAKAPVRTAATDRAMSAPGAYSGAPRTQPPSAGRTVGTQFNARLG